MSSPTSGNTNPTLAKALREGHVRCFRAGRGAAQGKTGPEDTAHFAENLMVLQECAILLGEQLGMNAVASAVAYDGEETVGFCFDPKSNPKEPSVAGGIVNRRMPVGQFIGEIQDFINE